MSFTFLSSHGYHPGRVVRHVVQIHASKNECLMAHGDSSSCSRTHRSQCWICHITFAGLPYHPSAPQSLCRSWQTGTDPLSLFCFFNDQRSDIPHSFATSAPAVLGPSSPAPAMALVKNTLPRSPKRATTSFSSPARSLSSTRSPRPSPRPTRLFVSRPCPWTSAPTAIPTTLSSPC